MQQLEPDTPLEKAFRLQTTQKSALKKLGLSSVADLLRHFPTRYESPSPVKKIATLSPAESASLHGRIRKIESAQTYHAKKPVTKGILEDETGTIALIWFSQPYVAKMYPEGSLVRVNGKTTLYGNTLSIVNPVIEHTSAKERARTGPLFTGGDVSSSLAPIYPESRGITSRWMYYAIQKMLSANIHDALTDPLPEALLKKYHLPALASALVFIHTPRKHADAEVARKRFAFEEVFAIQLGKAYVRKTADAEESCILKNTAQTVADFTARFPFTLTTPQQKAIETIIADMSTPPAMSRLLEGDVGSGKTAVAASVCYGVIHARNHSKQITRLQTALLAPTEILARQHFETFISLFSHLPVQIGLITAGGCFKFPSKTEPDKATKISRKQLLQWVASGEIAILIGTHSLIQKTIVFNNLALVIIDEQHRFGTKQRKHLMRKGKPIPHLLSMTATPIPRTLALTLYGDLDITLLDKMPSGRKPVITKMVVDTARSEAYEQIRTELRAGRQAYIICPRIDEPDPEKETALIAKSVVQEAEHLQKNIFSEFRVDYLHSKVPQNTREEVMNDFLSGKIQILVATSVIEVGVNVPNATIIIIEGAERYGLAQLHQLRGRVIRSTHQSYCFLVNESKGAPARKRLHALTTAKNGFDLSERDFMLRGAGDILGRKQWGISDLGMTALANLKMVEMARAEAKKCVEECFPFPADSPLGALMRRKGEDIHFE